MADKAVCGVIAAHYIDRVTCDRPAGHVGSHGRENTLFTGVPGTSNEERAERRAKQRRAVRRRGADAAELEAPIASLPFVVHAVRNGDPDASRQHSETCDAIEVIRARIVARTLRRKQ